MNTHFTYDERKQLAALINEGTPISHIAMMLNKSERCIYYELSRGKVDSDAYNPNASHTDYINTQSKKGKQKILEKDRILAERISKLIIKEHLSPEKISKIHNISVRTIYNAIDEGLIPNVNRNTLHSVVKVRTNGMIQIPKYIMEEARIENGNLFHIEVKDDNSIILKRIEN